MPKVKAVCLHYTSQPVNTVSAVKSRCVVLHETHKQHRATGNKSDQLDIVGTVYHLVKYMQSNKIHKVF